MFNYVGDISQLAQHIILSYCGNFENAIDCTLGNGHDTDFLSNHFKQVYSFDIQGDAIANYSIKGKSNVCLINNSHEYLGKYVENSVDCIMYNLGYMPGGNKQITTLAPSTIASVKEGLCMLNPGGIMSIAVYSGHEEGKKEKNELLKIAELLPKKEYGVMLHQFLNRNNISPILIIIEKSL